MSKLKKSAKFVLILIGVAAATFFAVRIHDVSQMPPKPYSMLERLQPLS